MTQNKDKKCRLVELAFSGSVQEIAALLNEGVDIYLTDEDQSNALHNTVGRMIISFEDDKVINKDSIKILKLLLFNEMERLAFAGKGYKDDDASLLKNQKNKNSISPEIYANARHSEVAAAFNASLNKAEEHYKKCLEAKKNGREITPYHKQFLPKLEEAEVQVELMGDSSKNRSWESKIDPTGLRKRNRTGSDEKEAEKNANDETKPLLKVSDTKTSPKKETLGLFTSVLNYFSSSSGNKSTIVH